MEPVTVLYLIDDLCGMAGAERVLINMVGRIDRGRFRCLVGTLRANPNLDIVRTLACPVFVFPLKKTYDLGALKIARELRRVIRLERVRIVHTFFETSDLWGSVVAKLSGCPIVVSSRRDMGFNQSAKHRLAYRLLRPVFNQVQTVSDQVRSMCIHREKFKPNRVVTLYNGVDLEKATAVNGTAGLRSSYGLDDASHVLISVGNIRWIKGTDILVEVAKRICTHYPRAVFVIVGKVLEPEYYDAVTARIRSLGLTNNVRFLGASENVFRSLKASDVFCLLSRSEGFSNALLEAMACGLPCVATDVGGNREALQDGRSGYLVPNEDVGAAADRILSLLGDPAKAREMGEHGRAVVESKFTTEVMVQKLASLYDSLLQRIH